MDNQKKWSIIIVLGLVVALTGAYYLKPDKTGKPRPDMAENKDNNNLQKELEPILFFKSWGGGQNAFVNIKTGEEISFAQGYYPIGFFNGNYPTFPTHLTFQKEDNLYAYDTKEKSFTEVLPQKLVLKENERVSVLTSITESGKYFIKISKFDPKEINYFGFTSLGDRTYIYDASLEKLTSIDAKRTVMGCEEFDSKNRRFFAWTCGEGAPTDAPLSIFDYSGKEIKEISDEYPVVRYVNGYIFMTKSDPQYGNIEVAVIDPKDKDLNVNLFEIEYKNPEEYYNPIGFDSARNMLVLSEKDSLLLAHFGGNKEVKNVIKVDDQISARAAFLHEGILYYQSEIGDNVQALDIESGKIIKGYKSPGINEAITILAE